MFVSPVGHFRFWPSFMSSFMISFQLEVELISKVLVALFGPGEQLFNHGVLLVYLFLQRLSPQVLPDLPLQE